MYKIQIPSDEKSMMNFKILCGIGVFFLVYISSKNQYIMQLYK